MVEGAVSEINEFGAFIHIGPMEASSTTRSWKTWSMNVGAGIIEGRSGGKRLAVGSHVRARIVSLSPDTTDPRRSKIGLTCKQPGLGPARRRRTTEVI